VIGDTEVTTERVLFVAYAGPISFPLNPIFPITRTVKENMKIVIKKLGILDRKHITYSTIIGVIINMI
jgi:hypothetical protein